jgi:Carboxypeptidase regulatory-like domain/TonB dependent receptor
MHNFVSRTKKSLPGNPGNGIRMLLVSIGALLFSLPVFSQANLGRILGAVTDQTGGVIAGAMVTVTNTGTGVARTLTTDQAGEYAAPNLIPGTYSVRAGAMGFQTFERQNITVGVGQDTRVDAQLTPGQVTQTVEVTAAAPLLDTTSAVVSGTLEAQTIVDLPMNGRNFANLLPLRPGVVASPGGGTLTTSTNGLQPQDNNYFFEGLDSNEPFEGQSVTNTSLPFGDAASILPVDAIQELNIETNGTAEFGRRPGAVINVGIKSGTNTIHGSAYAFGRDGAWDARDFINPPSTTPAQPVELEQWGATVGGPIIKNKLFYFAGFERQSYSVGDLFSANIPTSASIGNPSQSIPDAEAALNAAGIPISALSLKLLPQYGTNTGSSSALSIGFPDIFAINNGIGKLDYSPSDHHTLTGSYFYGEGSALGVSGVPTQPYFRDQGSMTAEFLTTSWTWTPNSTWANDLRFGWNRFDRLVNVANYQTPVTSYGINTGVTASNLQGLPTINVSGLSALGGDSKTPKEFGPGSDYDLVDHVSYLHGKHAFKFGGEVLFYNAHENQVSSGRGIFTFNGGQSVTGTVGTIASLTPLESFLAGDPTRATLLEGDPARTFTEWDFSGFFEDSWRATQKLTVNMGLRYEYYTPLSEINNLIGNFSTQVGFEQQGVNISHAYNPDPKDVSPRVGIAWDVTGKGTTVVRAGFGLYYTQIITQQLVGDTSLPGNNPGIGSIPTAYTTYLPNGATQAPLNPTNGIGSTAVTISGNNLNWTLAGPVFPASSTNGFVCGNGLKPVNPVPGAPATEPAPCSVLFISPNMPSPRVASWNVGIQHALTPKLSVKVDYVGNHGSDLPSITDLNQINPNSPAEIACGNCESPTHLPFYSQFPYLHYIDQMTGTDISNYNALQATFTARNFHNLSFIAGYTYSHALDDLPGGNFQSLAPENSLNPMGDYGASQFDIRHHFSFTPTYNIPGKKSPGQILQGWVVNSTIVIQGGLPWSPTDTRDLSKTGELEDRWDFFGNPGDFKAGPNPIPFYASGAANMPSTCTQAAAAAGGAATLAYGCYASGPGARSVMIAPAPGNFGTMARNLFHGPHFANWDFSIFKNTRIKERVTAQFRAEFFNIINHPNYGGVGTNPSAALFGCACETPDVAATNPVLGTGAAREIQLGLKLLF